MKSTAAKCCEIKLQIFVFNEKKRTNILKAHDRTGENKKIHYEFTSTINIYMSGT